MSDVMARSNFVLERAAGKAEFKKTKTVFSCAHKDRRIVWRDLHSAVWSQDSGAWSHARKHTSLSIDTSKEPYYEHLLSKAQKRSGCGVVKSTEQIRIPRLFLPPEINALREAINKSRSILELKDNSDDAESVACSESTWNRAQSFLMKNALKLWRSHKTCFNPPKILAGPEGSIDLHWKSATRELLINVPAGSQEPIGYYGDDRAEGTKNAVRGKDLESSTDAEWIFLWLTK
jgi:hypothetical protein